MNAPSNWETSSLFLFVTIDKNLQKQTKFSLSKRVFEFLKDIISGSLLIEENYFIVDPMLLNVKSYPVNENYMKSVKDLNIILVMMPFYYLRIL